MILEVSIGDCLGWFGFTINNLKDNHVTSLGYADNFDEGKKLHQVIFTSIIYSPETISS
jgi:hypothetical protein